MTDGFTPKTRVERMMVKAVLIVPLVIFGLGLAACNDSGSSQPADPYNAGYNSGYGWFQGGQSTISISRYCSDNMPDPSEHGWDYSTNWMNGCVDGATATNPDPSLRN